MDREWDLVRQFHKTFGHPVEETPRLLQPVRVAARASWMREEVDEFVASQDLYDQADAMIDLIYFALGTLVEMGVAPDRLFDVVHEANMAKLSFDLTPKYREDGKTVKPAGWIDPRERIRQVIDAVSLGGDEAANPT